MLPILAIYALMSLLTILVYAWDKRAAVRGRRRVPEQTLHGLALLGGIPGALLAQQLFRHKRRKGPFVFTTLLILALHVLGWGWYLTR